MVAFGTSAPEFAVSVQAALAGSAELAIGNVVGSNILNVLFILGLSALIVPLVVSSQLIRWDVPVMIVASLLMMFFSSNGSIDRLEGGFLLCGIVAYTWWCIGQSRKEGRVVHAEFVPELPPAPSQIRKSLVNLTLVIIGLVLLSGLHDLSRATCNEQRPPLHDA